MATAKHSTADLLAARREGLSYAAIGRRFGITKQSAWERIERAEKNAPTAPPPSTAEVIDIPAFLRPREAPAHPADAIILAVIQRDGIDAAQDRWPLLTIAELQRIKNAAAPPRVITEADIAGVEAYLAGKARPAAVTYTLPPDFDPATVDTATAGDVIAIIERPITEADDDYLPEPAVEVKPQRAPALNAPFVAEVYNRHGLDEVRRRWPEVSDDALDEAIRVGRRMVAPPTDDLPKGWGTRLAGAIARLFGRS